jgi:hypothetical protein
MNALHQWRDNARYQVLQNEKQPVLLHYVIKLLKTVPAITRRIFGAHL